MHEEAPKRVLLVGATGYAGRKLAHHLVTSTDAHVVLAGRNPTKLGDLEASLAALDVSGRTELLELEAARIDLDGLIDFDLLVNATGTGGHNTSMIRACIERQADWIDMQMTNELLNPPTELRTEIERAGCRFVIQAGFHPGILAALVRHAARQMDTVHSAIVGSVIRDKGGVPFTSGVTELVESFRDYKSEMYKDGRWQRLGYATYPMIEFEHGFGTLRAYPVEMPELRPLPALLPDLKNTGFFVAGFNWVADYLVTPLMMLTANVAPRRTARALGQVLSWSTRTFARPPYGTVVQVDADGRSDGRPTHFRLSMFHEDAYDLTAAPTVAMIKQMFRSEARPGIYLMGLCCDPIELLSDVERMGVAFTRQLNTSA